MAALHDALKALGPVDFDEVPKDDLKSFISDAFTHAQTIVDSVPLPTPDNDSGGLIVRSRSASSASEMLPSSARSSPPPPEVEDLQKEWKPVKMNPKDNPLGISVYKCAGKDGKGAWFARKSVHEGLGFTKWKRALEREFPETLKVRGGPGEGNIRGIGGERRVEYKDVEGVGKMEVYLLSAQFPGPTTPRDFVTMFLTSDQALEDESNGSEEIPRHFMVVSKPCNHSDTPPRTGYIRGYYESVEFIREIPIKKGPTKSASTTSLPSKSQPRSRSSSDLGREAILRNAKKNHDPPISEEEEVDVSTQKAASASDNDLTRSETRTRGKTISFDRSRGHDAKGEEMDVPREEESEDNPVEWIMITRSDPGGSVPRFMIERGTPGGIVGDASKFLDWACSKDMEELDSDDDESPIGRDEGDTAGEEHAKQHKHHPHHDHEHDIHNYQTNGHLVGIEGYSNGPNETVPSPQDTNRGGLYGMMAGAAGAAGAIIYNHTPAIIAEHFPHYGSESQTLDQTRPRPISSSSGFSTSTVGTFTSALSGNEHEEYEASSIKSTTSSFQTKTAVQQDKELQKLEEKKRKLDEKLNKAREKEVSKKTDDSEREAEALRRAEEKHEREVKKQAEKYKKEMEKLERKKEKEAAKLEEKRRKAAEKDERTALLRQVEELKAENLLLKKEKDLLRSSIGELQAENTALAAKMGRLGERGEEVLREARVEAGRGGRLRASSLKGLGGSGHQRQGSFRSSEGSVSREREKENLLTVPPAKS